jgi:hypothetical protein
MERRKLLLILAIDKTYMAMEMTMMNVFMTTAYSQRTKKVKKRGTAISASCGRKRLEQM